jgi:hypothetical protein
MADPLSPSFSTFASIGGCDIVTLMQGEVCGQLQALSVSISREKAPIHAMGRPDPRGFSRGKRGIAGSMVGVVFDNSWVAHTLKGGRQQDVAKKTYFWASDAEYAQFSYLLGRLRGDLFTSNNNQANEAFRQVVGGSTQFFTARTPQQAWYVDQILPFNIVSVGANEYGGATARVIVGAEILNEATGSSVDDIMLDESHTYVCLHVSPYIGLEFKSPITGATGAEAAKELFERAADAGGAVTFEEN